MGFPWGWGSWNLGVSRSVTQGIEVLRFPMMSLPVLESPRAGDAVGAWDACPNCSLLHPRHKDLCHSGFLGAWDWNFKFGIPWGFENAMVWGSWELGLWGLLGAIGFGGSGKFGTCTLGFGIT